MLCIFASTTLYAQNNPLDKIYNLGELYTRALQEDATLKGAEKDKEANLLNEPIARADLLPQLHLSYSYNRFLDQTITGQSFGVTGGGQSFEDYSTNNWQISLRQTLFNVPQILAFTQSRSATTAAELDYEQAKQDLILRLSEAYFAVLSAHNALAVADSEKAAFARQREQAEQNFEAGRTAITDIRSAVAAYDVATADEINAQNDLRVRLHQLTKIVNFDVKHLMQFDEQKNPLAPVPSDAEQWIGKALQNNVSILAEQIRNNIAKSEINRQRSKHLPSLDLLASRSDADIRGGPSPREYDDLQLGVELRFELFGGGRSYYQTKQAIEKADQNTYKLEQLRRDIKNNTREYYLNVVSGVAYIKALKEAVLSAQTAWESNQEGFEAGTRTSSDVLIALKDFHRTVFDYREAQHNYILNTLRLKRVVGNLTQQDIDWVDNQLTIK
ncbi:MAG: TolC family outer membrane protein [Candidatus Oxydemutatoraceae bacterium WSBS_2016_MAG_OTU14]